MTSPSSLPVVLHRCDQFVGRTTNWLYDHLRFIPRYTPQVLCDSLANRQEFPELQAWSNNSAALSRRAWGKVFGHQMFPSDAWRLRRLAPRALHSHFGYVAVEDIALAEFLNVAWFVGFYGADVYQLGLLDEWRKRYAPMFARAALVLALGPVMADELEKLGCPREKIRVHALGVDVHSLPVRPRVVSAGTPLRLLFAGTFREKKGIRYVIESAALARKNGVHLELNLVGDATGKPGDLEVKQAMLDQIRDLHLESVVTTYPYLSFKDLVALALECHVFIAPSVTAADGDREGTPFVLQQLMATGMPALATLHSDIPFLFGDLQSLLVRERDARALADRLIGYASNPDTLTSDGLALRDQMQDHFDVRKCSARLADFYGEFISR
jgi:colanic acid/amylovoran biosynthesis glycosyltransferase